MRAMLSWLERIWHWLTTSRYTRWLEAEVERLRAENLALRDSLGIPGFAQGTPRLRYRAHLSAGKKSEVGSPTSDFRSPPKAIRRPSVRQVLQRLEIEAAREAERLKKVASD